MKNTFKLSVLALAIAVSFAACKGAATSSSPDSAAKDTSVKTDTGKMKTDTGKMKMATDTGKKKM